MKFGLALGRLSPKWFEPITLEADKLGFESIWLSEHLILPVEMGGSPHAEHYNEQQHPPITANVPFFDPFVYLSYLAGKTKNIRLGTHVYLLGLRHPFVAARAIQTLDIISNGRAEIGIGAGWLRNEWTAAGFDPKTRGKRLDEALAVCKRLWTEDVIEHHGEFYDFDPVMFEAKPLQKPYPPILVGGESDAALRRAALSGNGWVGMNHTLESCIEPLARLKELLKENGRENEPFETVCLARVNSKDDIERWHDAGMTRLIVTPWNKGNEAMDGIRRFADEIGV